MKKQGDLLGFVYRLYICFLCLFGVVFGDYDWNSNPGDGTELNPYQISTAEQLASIGSDATLLDKYFILTDDIDMSVYPLTNSPIAPDTDQDNSYTDENRFSGSLDGQGHIIRNLTITRPGASYHIGLIGITTGSSWSSWEVKNLGLEGVDISVGDSSECIGGLIGRAFGGTVSDCYVTGSISSGINTVKMGGLMGFASTCNVSNCYVTESTITNGTGSSSTGGAIGYLSNNSLLDKCYSVAKVYTESTNPTVEALVGFKYNASINDCYFLATADLDNNNGEVRTTLELTQISNFTNWEFNGAQLGNQGHWRMRDDTAHYPYLAWEFTGSDFYGDFQIDLLDFAVFSQCWKTNTSSFDFNWLCDVDGTGDIGLVDLKALCNDWLLVYYSH